MSIKTVALNRIIGKVHLDRVTDVKQTSVFARLLFLYFVMNMCCKLNSLVNMTKPKLLIKLSVEQSIVRENDVNRLPYVRPELGEFATLFITRCYLPYGG